MTDHFTDSFSASQDEQKNLLVHRKDPNDPTKPPLTFELKKFEVIVLLRSLCDDAEYQSEIIAYLSSQGHVRPNHNL